MDAHIYTRLYEELAVPKKRRRDEADEGEEWTAASVAGIARPVVQPLIEVEGTLAAKPTPTKSQSQSLFFSKLPAEIRNSIYELAFGGRTIKLELVTGAESPRKRLNCSDTNQLFGFAKSCRLAYIEAVWYIYTGNTFFIDSNKYGLYSLPGSMHPAFLQAVCSICFRWRCTSMTDKTDFNTGGGRIWRKACVNFSTMKGLKHLRLILDDRSMPGCYSFPDESGFLQPFLGLADNTLVHVEVSWSPKAWMPAGRNGRWSWRKEWPFIISRGFDFRGSYVCKQPGCAELDEEFRPIE